jgi:hypothetical protein
VCYLLERFWIDERKAVGILAFEDFTNASATNQPSRTRTCRTFRQEIADVCRAPVGAEVFAGI